MQNTLKCRKSEGKGKKEGEEEQLHVNDSKACFATHSLTHSHHPFPSICLPLINDLVDLPKLGRKEGERRNVKKKHFLGFHCREREREGGRERAK